MPILINEVVTEVEPGVTTPHESQPPQSRTPVSGVEFDLLKTLALIEERKARLTID